MAEDKNKFLNQSGKDGLILAGIAIAYFIISALLGKTEKGGFLLSLLSFVLWAAKLALCIWLMFVFLRRFANENGKDRSRTFRFGMAIAACSALVYAGFYLLYVTKIDPGFFAGMFDSVAQTYSSFLNSEEIDRIMNMESSMPSITFFTNLIWCWLVGTIISAIASNNICGSDNPFENEN